MRMATERSGRASMLFVMLTSMTGAGHAVGLDETVGQLLHRDAQEAMAGKLPGVPAPPPRLLPEVAMAPLTLPPPPPVLLTPPAVTAIYGTPGNLSVVLQIDRQRVVLDQRTGRSEDATQPARLAGISGSCARIVLVARAVPTTLCVASGFGTARRNGGLP